MTPRLVLVVREDGSLSASCDCGGMDEIVAPEAVGKFMSGRIAAHVMLHSAAEPKRGKATR